MDQRKPDSTEELAMQKISHFQPSPAISIRSNLIFGLKLCAMARTENRMGSGSRVEQLLVKAKHVVENTLRDLHNEGKLPVSERCHLCKMLDQLQANIGGLDPLWTPNAGDVPAKNSDALAA